MSEAKEKLTEPLRGASGSAIHTEIKVIEEEPTMHLRWQERVLQQLWEVTERHMHYSGDHYNHSTYHKRKKWRVVDDSPNDEDQAWRE